MKIFLTTNSGLALLICLLSATAIYIASKLIKKKQVSTTTKDDSEKTIITAVHLFAILRKIADNAYLYSHDDSLFGKHIRTLIASDISTDYTLSAISFITDYKHSQVIRTLTLSHPNLSDKETAMCSMIILGCTNTEICSLMGYKTLNSVYVKKNRIKNKMHISSDKSLELYLSEITLNADNHI